MEQTFNSKIINHDKHDIDKQFSRNKAVFEKASTKFYV